MKSKGCKITTHFQTPSPHHIHLSPLSRRAEPSSPLPAVTHQKQEPGLTILIIFMTQLQSKFQKILGPWLTSCNTPHLHKGMDAQKTWEQISCSHWHSPAGTQKELSSKANGVPTFHVFLKEPRGTPRVTHPPSYLGVSLPWHSLTRPMTMMAMSARTLAYVNVSCTRVPHLT